MQAISQSEASWALPQKPSEGLCPQVPGDCTSRQAWLTASTAGTRPAVGVMQAPIQPSGLPAQPWPCVFRPSGAHTQGQKAGGFQERVSLRGHCEMPPSRSACLQARNQHCTDRPEARAYIDQSHTCPNPTRDTQVSVTWFTLTRVHIIAWGPGSSCCTGQFFKPKECLLPKKTMRNVSISPYPPTLCLVKRLNLKEENRGFQALVSSLRVPWWWSPAPPTHNPDLPSWEPPLPASSTRCCQSGMGEGSLRCLPHAVFQEPL